MSAITDKPLEITATVALPAAEDPAEPPADPTP